MAETASHGSIAFGDRRSGADQSEPEAPASESATACADSLAGASGSDAGSSADQGRVSYAIPYKTNLKPGVVQVVVPALESHLTSGEQAPKGIAAVWACVDQAAGSIEAPTDWSAEHDHYLYGTPNRGDEDKG